MTNHRAVHERIEKLSSAESVQNRSELSDALVVQALAERRMFPVASNIFDYHSKKTGESPTQKELNNMGLDTVWWSPVYSKIVKSVCEEGNGDLDSSIVEAQINLENAVYERAAIHIAYVKFGMDLNRSKTISDAKDAAKRHNFDESLIEPVYNEILARGKDFMACAVQRYFPQRNQKKKKEVRGPSWS